MFTACLLLTAAVGVGQPPEVPPFVKDYAKAVTFYYQAPDPTLGPKVLKEFLKKENLEHPWIVAHEHVQNLNIAALGDIGAGQPKVVREYEAAFADAPHKGRRLILRVLANCGDKKTVEQVNAWLADDRYAEVRAELQSLKKSLEGPKRKHACDRAARTPDDLDFLWVNFFVTGEYAPIARLLDVFDVPDTKENAVLKRVARWSLGSSLQQHPPLVVLLQKHAKDRPEASRKVIDELMGTLKSAPAE
jgi:hypothetical protein